MLPVYLRTASLILSLTLNSKRIFSTWEDEIILGSNGMVQYSTLCVSFFETKYALGSYCLTLPNHSSLLAIVSFENRRRKRHFRICAPVLDPASVRPIIAHACFQNASPSAFPLIPHRPFFVGNTKEPWWTHELCMSRQHWLSSKTIRR